MILYACEGKHTGLADSNATIPCLNTGGEHGINTNAG